MFYPLLLWGIERFSHVPFWLRMPSLLASMGSVLCLLALGKTTIGYKGAIYSALILATSPTQIRYAQEVREYAVTVFLSSLLLVGIIWREAPKTRRRGFFCIVFFMLLAPLTQYGLVLLACATLVTQAVFFFLHTSHSFHRRHLLISALSLGIAGLCSLLLTLQYQWMAGGFGVTYLEEHYFDPQTHNVISFIINNSLGLFKMTFGRTAKSLESIGLIGLSMGLYLFRKDFIKRRNSLVITTIFAVGINIVAALFRYYPYGSLRQCIYLTPLLSTVFGVALGYLATCLDGRRIGKATILIAMIMLVINAWNIEQINPYQEVENTKAVIARLNQEMLVEDSVFIHPNAKPAVMFYLDSFEHLNQHNMFSDSAIMRKPPSGKIWMIFAHMDEPEIEDFINDLPNTGTIKAILSTEGARLYRFYSQNTENLAP
ncbi:MAG: glycosyltransferase family 39 protein [Lentisphaerae bacterium]|nr:glycosyltransferase family 39 protein [Lentisphaerota bacterium]